MFAPIFLLSGVAHYKNPSQTLKSHSQPVLKKLVSLDSTTFFQGLVLLNWPRPVQRGPDFCLFGWHLLVKDPDHASGITSNKFCSVFLVFFFLFSQRVFFCVKIAFLCTKWLWLVRALPHRQGTYMVPGALKKHTFSAFWLRSSVVSVLISLISGTWRMASHEFKWFV